MHIFLPSVVDTGYVKDLDDTEIVALCDHLNEAHKTIADEVVKLRWTKGKVRSQKDNLLLITKYWVTPFGIRKLRVQCHRIHENGRIGTRVILEERRQGRQVR